MVRFEEYEKQLDRWINRRVFSVISDLRAAQRDVQAAIADAVETGRAFTVDRLQAVNQQIDAVQADLKRRIQVIGPSARPLAEMVAAHHTAAFQALTGRAIYAGFNELNLQTLALFSFNELEKVTSIVVPDKLGQIKAALRSSVGVQGLNPRAVARALAGQEGWGGTYARVENIIRTESSTVYNARAVQSIQEVNEQYDLDMRKQIIETIDNKRNHPISQVLNLQVREAADAFQARVATVEETARRLGKSGRGVFWPVIDGVYTSQRLPAHYRERGVVVPTEDNVTPLK